MPVPATYAVDASRYGADFRALSQYRLLDQFKAKPVLQAVLNALVDEAQEWYDTCIELLTARSLYAAAPSELDALGRIVGQRREPVANDVPVYFTPDTPRDGTADELGADLGIAWVTGVPATGLQNPTEAQYAEQILGRITNNMTRHGSIPELAAAIYQTLGLKVRFDKTGPMEVDIYVSGTPTADAMYKLDQKRDTQRTQGRYFFGYPATLSIGTVQKEGA
jgi:hypothetical protein